MILQCDSHSSYAELAAIADPFVCSIHEKIYVLAEIEGIRNTGNYFKKIGAFSIADDLKKAKYLGELWNEDDGEYSFPYLYIDNDKIYMLPDMNESGNSCKKHVRIYSTSKNAFPFGWQRNCEILTDDLVRPSDKVLLKHGKTWFLFVSDLIDGGQLKLLISDDLKSWRRHPESPILKRKIHQRLLNRCLPYRMYRTKPWRLGGGPAKMGNILVLPVQHQYHQKVYGEVVSLLYISRLDANKIEFSVSDKPFLVPDQNTKWRCTGAHHFSLAIDGSGRKLLASDGFDGVAWSSAIELVDETLPLTPI